MLYQLSYSRPLTKYLKWWWMLDSNQRSVTATGLQPVPFSHSGNPPLEKTGKFNYSGAGEGTRTPDRLITNQLLYQLSYASVSVVKKTAAPSEAAVG